MEPLGEEAKEDKVNKIWELVENGEAGKANWIYKAERLKALWAIQEELHDVGKVLGDIREQLFLTE